VGARLLYDGTREVGVQETFTCAHCNRPKPRYTWNGRKLEIVRCAGCSGAKPAYICQDCAKTGVCSSFEKKLDEIEAGRLRGLIERFDSRQRFLRSMGL